MSLEPPDQRRAGPGHRFPTPPGKPASVTGGSVSARFAQSGFSVAAAISDIGIFGVRSAWRRPLAS
jgi:hypothetical protein